MLNIEEVINTVNAVISRKSKNHYSSVMVRGGNKPNYNNGLNTPKVCSLNLDVCKRFYKESPSRNLWERKCPFGYKVASKAFDTSSSHGKISIFTIVSYERIDKPENLLSNLPRNLKSQKDAVIAELNGFEINEDNQRTNKQYIEGLLETLLIGRIGLSIQSISHQFFTPLQGAMSDVKNIEIGQDIEESIVRLSKNFNSLNKLATEIQLILSTSEDFNKNMLRRVTVHNMVNEIIDSLSAATLEKSITLNQGYNHGPKSVDAIPSQLNIVLSNLISNAVKYSFKPVKGQHLEISIIYKQDDDFLILEIVNEGCRITEYEIRNRLIFNLSYRGEYSGDRERPGSGSGLYISDKIAKVHGGGIEVASLFVGGSKHNGTDRYKNTFVLKWPISII
ncbi:MAG: HAMP domain-containing sensor histidine kinase [Cyclobacteriaceae bacterium]